MMNFDLQRIIESKRTYRQHLATLPIGEKLRLLDAMRERELAIRGRNPFSHSATSVAADESTPNAIKPR